MRRARRSAGEATGGAPAVVCGAAAVKDYENRLPPATP
jgi:hypothetical protein